MDANEQRQEAQGGNEVSEVKKDQGQTEKEQKVKVIYKFCDLQQRLVDEWRLHFKDYIPDRVQVYKGDIFKDGPAADAIVSPANSFGFMDGGIDMVYSRHFGWQMQERLQKLIRKDYDGEVLVGNAVIMTTVEHHNRNVVDWSKFNEGQPIKYLISAPTMRVPMDVSDTSNAYLAFRAIILAVWKFNESNPADPIRSVLCPGLGTAVGYMPRDRCAYQMLRAFQTFELGTDTEILNPNNLAIPLVHHYDMAEFGGHDVKKGPPKDKVVIKTSNKTTKVLEKTKADQKNADVEPSDKGAAENKEEKTTTENKNEASEAVKS
ncbi:uncharacterized protein LOC132757408 [Ruditapes philippinarum]|uniref:uncharacterized protein LOC132757408 n=1 Tax=Ruditapes philippinarum TaxID=129788 RepID=UPI00295AEEEA|nr:uncharacterized protein LOC132757408 [Ruditapes philippinarum]